MASDKSTTIAPTLCLKASSDVEEDRLDYIRARLQNLLADELSPNPDLIEVQVSVDALSLSSQISGPRTRVAISFHKGAAHHRRLYGGGKSQHLAKAVGIDQKKGLSLIDATAGLAGDSFVLASLGARVQMLERSPVLALMIEQALVAASQWPEADSGFLEIIERMSLIETEASSWLSAQSGHVAEVIFLDPMFPEKKKKAAVKKEMQILQQLLTDTRESDIDRQKQESDLLDIALAKAVNRVVVKRPRHAPHLAGKVPSYCLEGKSTRFDIYAIKKIS